MLPWTASGFQAGVPHPWIECDSGLAKLAGGVAVIRVGGATEVEAKEASMQ
jgi:hypothetical protein